MKLGNAQIAITFKNVGQGDTIILEWMREGKLHVGFIDCKKDEKGNNPAVSYLEGHPKCIIDFIILSHPHADHCSGVTSLLEYLLREGRSFNELAHPYYLDARFKVKIKGVPRTLLGQIKNAKDRLVRELMRGRGMLINNGTSRELNKHIQWRCLTPSDDELERYGEGIGKNTNDARKLSALANLLSTIIKIESKENFVLLTSDAERSSFEMIVEKNLYDFNAEELMLAQIPHHGSDENYCHNFWKVVKKVNNPVAVISVGPNDYGHPSNSVIKKLSKIGYIVHRTDGKKPKHNSAEVNVRREFLVDDISIVVDTENSGLQYLVNL